VCVCVVFEYSVYEINVIYRVNSVTVALL